MTEIEIQKRIEDAVRSNANGLVGIVLSSCMKGNLDPSTVTVGDLSASIRENAINFRKWWRQNQYNIDGMYEGFDNNSGKTFDEMVYELYESQNNPLNKQP